MRSLRPRLGPATARTANCRPGNSRLPPVLRRPTPEDATHLSDPLARDLATARLEAALFLAEEPITTRRLAEVARLTDATAARQLVRKLAELYDAEGSAFQVEELAGGFQLLTRPVYHPWLLRLRRTGHDLRLTPASLETLAVIAYRQPITRAEIELVRGVQCAELVRVLMEKGLVRVTGRHPSLGRPQLYGTTRRFLQAFGLGSLKDLPEVESMRSAGPDHPS